jgi:hypothetical protein
MNDEPETIYPESFPYPKIIQVFNYFFPKKKGAPDLFTMENLRKFSRYAPYLGIGIPSLVFASCFLDAYMMNRGQPIPLQYELYSVFDVLFLIITLIQYFWYLGGALIVKCVRRSPIVPLALSFFSPLKSLMILGIIHFFCWMLSCFYKLIALLPPEQASKVFVD